ncbi:MAG: hypothetical protein HOK80_05840 [Candidatus Cloacimonetes bacterium]|jgi:hypothetical protein|nr:hypothetical protein [Candidatus Cloacimonadota bacterium]
MMSLEVGEANHANKAIVIGSNRSGSTLLFSIIRKIISLDGADEKKQLLSESEKATACLQHKLRVLDEAFKLDDSYESSNSSTQFGRMHYCCGNTKSYICVGSFPIKRHLFNDIYRTYSVLCDEILEAAEKNSQKLFYPLRDPLDVIVSNAFEMEDLAIWRHLNGTTTEEFSRFREEHGRRFLNNLSWFEDMLGMLSHYSLAYLEFKDRVKGVSYEDVLDAPVTMIKEIANHLCVNISSEIAENIWSKLAFKPLSKSRSHYFQPGKGKWKRYLSSEHLKILQQSGFEKLFAKLGYHYNISDIDNGEPSFEPAGVEAVDEAVAIRDNCFSMMFGMSRYFKPGELITDKMNVKGEVVECLTNSREKLSALKNILNNNASREILYA